MKSRHVDQEALLPTETELVPAEVPPGVDRRTFMMRSAVISSAAVITGCTPTEKQQTAAASAPPPVVKENVSPDLERRQEVEGSGDDDARGVLQGGPGPSSSHTIGPMRITYDFYQRCTKLPPETLAKATALKVHLFGSLSATGLGHGTERAALAGIVGKEPATVDPALPRRPA